MRRSASPAAFNDVNGPIDGLAPRFTSDAAEGHG